MKALTRYPEPSFLEAVSYRALLPAELTVATPAPPAQNPTKAHLGLRALHLHTAHHHLTTGPYCLLGSPSNKTSCRATLSTSGLFQLRLVSRRERSASRLLSWGL